MDVSIEPGATTLTRRGASSTARARVNPSTALPTQDIEDIPGLHLRAGNPLTSVMEASSASQGLQLRIAASFFGDEERNSLLVEENERLHDRYIKEINDFLEFDTSLKAESVVSGFIEEIKELGVSLLNKSLGSDSFRALMEGKDVGTYEQSKIVNESSNTANESVSMGAGQKKVEEITSEVSQKPPSSSLTYKAPMTASIKVVFFASIGIAVGLFLLTIEADSQNQFPAFIWAYTAWKTYKQDFAALVTAQKVLAGIAALAVIWGAVTVGDAKSELILGLSPSDMILGG